MEVTKQYYHTISVCQEDLYILLYFCLHSITLSSSKIGEEQLPEDAEDGPPELLVSNPLYVSWKFLGGLLARLW